MMKRAYRLAAILMLVVLSIGLTAGAFAQETPQQHPLAAQRELLRTEREILRGLRQQIRDLNHEIMQRLPDVRQARDFDTLRQIHAIRGTNIQLRIESAGLLLDHHAVRATLLDAFEQRDPDLGRLALEQAIAITAQEIAIAQQVLSNLQLILDLLA